MEQSDSSYLLEPHFWGYRGQGGRLVRLVVVGPYPTDDFFRLLPPEPKAKEIVLVVDDAWSAKHLEEIKRQLGEMDIQSRIRYASSGDGGLVHAKLYFLDWKVRGASEWQVLWGSANASSAAFEKNAEALSSMRLSAHDAAAEAIEAYVRDLTSEEKVSSRVVMLAREVSLKLPSMTLTDVRAPATFDSWLQAGSLCHRYQPDPSFGRLSITLDEPLPKDLIERSFARQDLTPEGGRSAFRWAYSAAPLDPGESKPRWRASYFIETWLGYWTSEECYRDREREFQAPGKERRERMVGVISRADKNRHDEWERKLLERVQRAIRDLKTRDKRFSPSTYFKMDKAGTLSDSVYCKNLRNQLQNQKKRSSDRVFQAHFVTGYTFHEIPPFRASGVSFNDFAESFCEGIQLALVRDRTPSRLADTVVEAFREDSPRERERARIRELPSKSLLAELRLRWPTIGPRIRQFHQDVERNVSTPNQHKTCQAWLREAGYEDIADQIDRLEIAWSKKSSTRRNWWDVLAGTRDGQRKRIGGHEFQVIAAARERKQWEVTPGALRNPGEPPVPPIRGS